VMRLKTEFPLLNYDHSGQYADFLISITAARLPVKRFSMASTNNIPAPDISAPDLVKRRLTRKVTRKLTRKLSRGIVMPAHRSEPWARIATLFIFLLAFAYTIWSAREMSGGMRMPGGWTMPMMWMAMPGSSIIASSLTFLCDVAGHDDRDDASIVLADAGVI